jgi:hypothetical protein
MRLPAQLPHYGFDLQREFTFWSKLGTFFLRLIWLIQIHPAIRALHQIMVNIRAAIATFDFIIFGWGSEAGGHEGIVSRK